MAHSILSPSGFKSHMLCPGKREMEKGMDDQSSIYAEEGTAAHELLEIQLTNDLLPRQWQPITPPFIGKNGAKVDADGIQHVKEAFDFVINLMGTMKSRTLLVEQHVDPGITWMGQSVSHGTADILLIDHEAMTLYVLDYKHGKGHPVEIKDNVQLVLYALGALNALVAFDFTSVVTGILQPRAHHVDGPFRLQKQTVDHIIIQRHNLQKAAERSMQPDAPCTAGEEQCRWCRAKATCTSIADLALARARATFKPITQETTMDIEKNVAVSVNELTDDQLKIVLDNRNLVIGWLDAVKAHAEKRFEDGKPLPGYKMVAGRTTRKWDKDDLAVIKLFSNLKVRKKEVMAPEKVKSVAQMEKTVKPTMTDEQWAKVEKHIMKTTGKPALVPETDKRPGLPSAAKEVFQPVLEFLS